MRLHHLLLLFTLIALFTFRDYGYTWDEPLYYGYAEALPYAYNPLNWFRADFDLEKSYGPSPEDHKTRGPAYLLFAQPLAALLQHIGLARDEAWHLVNFLAFLGGLSLFHRLARRWFSPFVSLTITALFATQPLLWGHAFINPKDIPFLFAFLGTILFGLEMVDAWAEHPSWRRTLLATFFLGFATVLRILAPLAGLLILAYAPLRRVRPPLIHLLTYLFGAGLVTFALWPYLWEHPIQHFIQVFLLMSNNVASMKVLFNGYLYTAISLPRRYLPFLIWITLTETTWLLAGLGLILTLILALRRSRPRLRIISDPSHRAPTPSIRLAEAGILAAWFLIPLGYVIILRPPMYDSYRHFLFILPPIFYFGGLGLEYLLVHLRFPLSWRILLVFLLLFPGLIGIAILHPYEYTYYNSLIGGPVRAFGRFETDYWLTCYKESVQQLNARLTQPVRLFVWREPYIAAYYAGANIQVHSLREEPDGPQRGDYLLVSTRALEDRGISPFAPEILRIQRAGATFCIIRRLGK